MGFLRWTYPGEIGHPWGMVDCLHNSQFNPPATSRWLLPKVERKEQGHEVTRASGWNRVLHLLVPSQLSPSYFGDTHMLKISTHARARTHTAASCLLLSQDYSSLSLFVCQPHAGKHRLLKMEVHSFIVGNCLILLSRAWRHWQGG